MSPSLMFLLLFLYVNDLCYDWLIRPAKLLNTVWSEKMINEL